MRQYRGMTKEAGYFPKGTWVYGSLIISHDGYTYIFDTEHGSHIDDEQYAAYNLYEVIPSTVGQSTGLKDKNGKEIYEGDWVEWDEQDEEGNYKDSGIVVWDTRANGWKVEYIFNRGGKHKYPPELWFFDDLPVIEVIGTIHQEDSSCP